MFGFPPPSVSFSWLSWLSHFFGIRIYPVPPTLILIVGLVAASISTACGGDNESASFFQDDEISRVIRGDDVAEAFISPSESGVLKLETKRGVALYVPPGSLSKEATITIEGGIQSYPAAQGYGISTVASVSLGTAKVDSAIVLEFDASPNSIVLHQVDNEWISVPTTVRGGKAYGVAHSASLFAVAELAPMPQLKTLSGPCFVLGFTGWKADPNIALLATPLNLFALDSIPDFLEARSERDEINADSGVNQLVQNAILNGLEPSQFLMLRHYEWNQPGGGIESVYRAADRGDRIVLLGHSAGGAAALHVAWELRANGIPVELLVELDTYIGWPPNYPWLTADGRSAPKKVIRGVNYYQTMGVESPLGGVLPLYSGRVQSYGSDGNHSGSNLAPVPHGQVPIWVAATQDLAIEALLDACAPGEQVAIEDSDGDLWHSNEHLRPTGWSGAISVCLGDSQLHDHLRSANLFAVWRTGYDIQ